MAYCDRDDVGLGFLPAIGVMSARTSPNILLDPRFSAQRFGLPGGPAPAPKKEDKAEAIAAKPPAEPTPAPAPSVVTTSPTGEVPAPSTGGGGPVYTALPYERPEATPISFAPGDVQVTVAGAEGAEAPRGFGMVEAAIAAGLAALLASTWSRRKR